MATVTTRPHVFRYVDIAPNAGVAEIDAALAELRHRLAVTNYEIVRGWVKAEIDVVLDMRLKGDA